MGRLLVKITKDHIRFRYNDFARTKWAREKEREDERRLKVTPWYQSPAAIVTKDHIIFDGHHIPNEETDGYVPMTACPNAHSISGLLMLAVGLLIGFLVCLVCVGLDNLPTETYQQNDSFTLSRYSGNKVCLTSRGQRHVCVNPIPRHMLKNPGKFRITEDGWVFYGDDTFVMSQAPVDVRDVVKHWVVRARGPADKDIKTVVSEDGSSLVTFSPETCSFKFVAPHKTHTWTLSTRDKCDRLVLQADNNPLWASNTERHNERLQLKLTEEEFCLANLQNECRFPLSYPFHQYKKVFS